MRSPEEQRHALECLKLAQSASYTSGYANTGIGSPTHAGASAVVARAAEYLAFILQSDTDDAKAKLAIVREALG